MASNTSRNAARDSTDTGRSAGSGPRSVHSCGIRIRTPSTSQKNVNRPPRHRPANTRNRRPRHGWKG